MSISGLRPPLCRKGRTTHSDGAGDRYYTRVYFRSHGCAAAHINWQTKQKYTCQLHKTTFQNLIKQHVTCESNVYPHQLDLLVFIPINSGRCFMYHKFQNEKILHSATGCVGVFSMHLRINNAYFPTQHNLTVILKQKRSVFSTL
jgi:hypothetical protein